MPTTGSKHIPSAETPLQSPVAALVARLHKRQPLRVWSLIVTVFGDMVAPRGGEIWAGSLADLLAGMDIDATAVRAALSRLTRDGWLERMKVGRLSYYRLSSDGRDAFEPALARVYRGPGDDNSDTALHLVLLPEGDQRGSLREAAIELGYGALGPSVLVATPATPKLQDEGVQNCIVLEARVLHGTAKDLVDRAFDLEPLAARYHAFQEAYAPLEAALADGDTLSDLDAAVARALLIHDFRRVVLRDPMLPSALLPKDWPGGTARALTARLYRRLGPGAARWLAEHGQCRDGQLPDAASLEDTRFLS